MTKKIVTLSGDCIGPEIMAAGLGVLDKVASKIEFDYDVDAKPFGGAGIDAEGHPLPKATLEAAKSADAILLLLLADLNMIMHQFVPNKGFWPFVRS